MSTEGALDNTLDYMAIVMEHFKEQANVASSQPDGAAEGGEEEGARRGCEGAGNACAAEDVRKDTFLFSLCFFFLSVSSLSTFSTSFLQAEQKRIIKNQTERNSFYSFRKKFLQKILTKFSRE